MPDTSACICIDLYHTSIAMCLCSFIWFARALFLNAECSVFARCKGCMSFSSWHCTRHSFVGKSLIPKDTQNDTVLTFLFCQTSPLLQPPNFLGQCLLIQKGLLQLTHFKHGIKRCQVRFSSGAVAYVVALGDLCASFRNGSTNLCLIAPPAPCSLQGYAGVLINPTDDVKEA